VVHGAYELLQLDVDSAFLNATVKEEIYMRQPPGYETGASGASAVPLVCLLRKAIYGIKQAPAEWNNEVNGTLVGLLGFTRCVSDSCVYYKLSQTHRPIILFLFVDDMIIAVHPEDVNEWNGMKHKLGTKYKLVDLGQCNWILQMRLVYDKSNSTIRLHQEVYVNKVLQRFNMLDCTPVATPTTLDKLIKADTSARTDHIKPYCSLVGSLLYAAISNRVDISYAVAVLTRFMSQHPDHTHWQAAKRVLRYLSADGVPALSLECKKHGISSSCLLVKLSACWEREEKLVSVLLTRDCKVLTA
jgi:hypothetical protein